MTTPEAHQKSTSAGHTSERLGPEVTCALCQGFRTFPRLQNLLRDLELFQSYMTSGF